MRPRFAMASMMLVLFVFGTSALGARHIAAPLRHCDRLFTVKMDKRAAVAIYRSTRKVTIRNLRLLGYIERCQKNPAAQSYVRWYNHHRAASHKSRIYEHTLQENMQRMHRAVVSWYNDGGSTASGFHSYYGVAVCGSGGGPCVPFGTRIEFCYHGCVVAVADDHGPYVAGRGFDLNQNTASAIGAMGVESVGYYIY